VLFGLISDLAGYPANIKAWFWISGHISGKAGYRLSGSTERLLIKYNTPAISKGQIYGTGSLLFQT
jgi:hypothetical protein